MTYVRNPVPTPSIATMMNGVARAAFVLASALALGACDQPMAAPAQPRPVAAAPSATVRAGDEARVQAVLRALVRQAGTPEGAATLRPKQESAERALAAALTASPGSAERASVDEVLARLRALAANGPGAGSR
jgi:hypothetical protein